MDPIKQFQQEVSENIKRLGEDTDVQALSRIWVREIAPYKYAYNFTWLGRPIIQFPQDIVAVQEIIWSTQPDLIVETGIAHGGSLILSASLLELMGGDRQVIGVDIDIRPHNRKEIESHPMFKRIRLLEGSSIDPKIVATVFAAAKGKKNVLVILDSNHTHEHVLEELHRYAPLVKEGGHLIVLDTLVEDMPNNQFDNRPWGKGDNPKTAVAEFLIKNDRFVVNLEMEHKLLITSAPSGFLKCVKS